MQWKHLAWILPAVATLAIILSGFFLTTLWSEIVEYDKNPRAAPGEPGYDPAHEPDHLFPRDSHETLTAAGGWGLAGMAFGGAWWSRQRERDAAAERWLLLGGAVLVPLILLVDTASWLSAMGTLAAAAYCLRWNASPWTRAGMTVLVGAVVVFLVEEFQSGAAWTALLLVLGLLAYPIAWAVRTRDGPERQVPLLVAGGFSVAVLLLAMVDAARIGGTAEWGTLLLAVVLVASFAVVGLGARPAVQSD